MLSTIRTDSLLLPRSTAGVEGAAPCLHVCPVSIREHMWVEPGSQKIPDLKASKVANSSAHSSQAGDIRERSGWVPDI